MGRRHGRRAARRAGGAGRSHGRRPARLHADLGYGLRNGALDPAAHAAAPDAAVAELDLPALLSRVLLSFALEFEDRPGRSLAIAANVLRVLDEQSVRMRDLPPLAGVSKEAIAMALGILDKRGLVAIARDPAGGRGQVVALTTHGSEARDAYLGRVDAIEQGWRARFGEHTIAGVRDPPGPALRPRAAGWRTAAAAGVV